MTKKLFVKTHGCQMNEYDSAKMIDLLKAEEDFELVDSEEQADLLVLNTCSIREKAQERVFHQIGRWRKIKDKKPPCAFNLNDSRFKRVIMDYINQSSIIRYENFEELLTKNKKSRVILMSTKAKKSLFKFKFKKNDIILLGRESKGVPDYVHQELKDRLKIPMSSQVRSLNVAVTASISAAEALRQIKKF